MRAEGEVGEGGREREEREGKGLAKDEVGEAWWERSCNIY